MPTVVYGMFRGPAEAGRVAERLNHIEAGNAVVHEHGVREEEVQLGGTLALRNGIVTAMVVGLFAGFLIWAVLWPMNGMMLGFPAFALLVFGGSTFGLVAGAVAGASECKPALVEVAHRADAEGRTVVTCEVPASDVDEVVRAMTEAGGAVVHAA